MGLGARQTQNLSRTEHVTRTVRRELQSLSFGTVID